MLNVHNGSVFSGKRYILQPKLDDSAILLLDKHIFIYLLIQLTLLFVIIVKFFLYNAWNVCHFFVLHAFISWKFSYNLMFVVVSAQKILGKGLCDYFSSSMLFLRLEIFGTCDTAYIKYFHLCQGQLYSVIGLENSRF